MRSKVFKLLILLGMLLFSVTACNEAAMEVPGAVEEAASSGQAGSGEPYRIGLFFSVTGPISSLGIPERDTAMMVVEQVNAAGGIKGPDGLMHPLEVVFEDDQSNPDEAVLIVKKLIGQDQVPVIVGGSGSPTSMAVIDSATEAKVPFISLGSSSSIVLPIEERQWVFKTPQQNRLVAEIQGDWLIANGITQIASLGVNNAFGVDSMEALQNVAKAGGLEIVYEDTFEPGDTDFSAQLTQVAGSGVEALVVHATPAEAAPLTVQFRDLGLEMPLLHSPGIGNRDFIDMAGEAAEGVLFPNSKLLVAESLPDSDPQKAVLMKFIDDYARYTGGAPPNTFGAHAWDAMQMSIMALQAVGPDPAAIREYLENIDNFTGLSGVFSLSPEDHNGIRKESLVMVQIKDGDWVYVRPQAYAGVQ